MYESPIRLLTQQLETHMREQHDKQIFEAIQKFGVDVDRDELIKALAYDRDQYDKGYADGRADAQRWISVEERLPEKMKNVLVFKQRNGHALWPIAEWHIEIDWRGEDGWSNNLDNGYFDITHWAPLPEPPNRSE